MCGLFYPVRTRCHQFTGPNDSQGPRTVTSLTFVLVNQSTSWTGHTWIRLWMTGRGIAHNPVQHWINFVCVFCVQVASQAGVYELLNQLGFSEFEDLRDSTLCRLRRRWQQQNRHGLPFRGEFIWETLMINVFVSLLSGRPMLFKHLNPVKRHCEEPNWKHECVYSSRLTCGCCFSPLIMSFEVIFSFRTGIPHLLLTYF